MYQVLTDSVRQKQLLVVIALAVFLDSLDGSIVNIALPTIAQGFSADISLAAWVIMAYFLFLVGLIPIFGKIADHGRLREVFCLGFLVFTVGSVLCSLSPDLSFLTVFRAVQGVGASMIAVTAPLLIVRLLPQNHWGLGMGLTATAGAVALVFGPVLGGLITEYLGWHWCFLMNVPIGVAAIWAGLHVIPKAREMPAGVRFDLPGALLIFAAIASLVYVLERGGSAEGAGFPVVVCAVVFCVSAVGFVVRELSAADPVLRVRVFLSLPFTLVTVSYVLISVVYAGFLYIIPFYLSIVCGFSPAQSGLILLISSVITAVMGLPSGALSDSVGCRWLVTVAGCVRVGFCVVMAVLVPEWGLVWLVVLMVLSGVTFGVSGGPSAARVVEHAPRGEGGTGSVVLMLGQYFGMVVGVALYALVFTLGSPGSAGVAVSLLTAEEFLPGFHLTGWFGVVCSVLVVVCSAVVADSVRRRGSVVG